MNKNDRAILAEMLFGIAEVYTARLTEVGVKMYLSALDNYNIADIKSALNKVLKTKKYNKMPTIGEIVEYIEGTEDDIAEAEAAKAIKSVQHYGCYYSMVFDDPVTQAVIDSFGGWIDFANQMTLDNQKYVRMEFIKKYKAFNRKGVKRFGKMHGIVERHNVQNKGIEGQGVELIFIGNAKKAEHVLDGQIKRIQQ